VTEACVLSVTLCAVITAPSPPVSVNGVPPLNVVLVAVTVSVVAGAAPWAKDAPVIDVEDNAIDGTAAGVTVMDAVAPDPVSVKVSVPVALPALMTTVAAVEELTDCETMLAPVPPDRVKGLPENEVREPVTAIVKDVLFCVTLAGDTDIAAVSVAYVEMFLKLTVVPFQIVTPLVPAT
jgi:hypothetical protein